MWFSYICTEVGNVSMGGTGINSCGTNRKSITLDALLSIGVGDVSLEDGGNPAAENMKIGHKLKRDSSKTNL